MLFGFTGQAVSKVIQTTFSVDLSQPSSKCKGSPQMYLRELFFYAIDVERFYVHLPSK